MSYDTNSLGKILNIVGDFICKPFYETTSEIKILFLSYSAHKGHLPIKGITVF